MTYGGFRNWPPVWTPLNEPVTCVLTGEIGVLRNVSYNAMYPARCELAIGHNGVNLTGTLMFDDARFCWLITNLLKSHTRRSIKDIGGLDVA